MACRNACTNTDEALSKGNKSLRDEFFPSLFTFACGHECGYLRSTRPEAQPVENGSAPVRLQATFCVGKRWVSTLVASGPAAKGVDDPAFRALMEQVSYELLPPKNKKNYSSAMAE
jgi:hypothetical protein